MALFFHGARISSRFVHFICARDCYDPFMGWPDEIPLNPALDRATIIDGRARFREVLDAVNRAHGQALPDYRPTDDILRELAPEASPSGKPVALDTLPSDVRVIAAPGFLTECIEFLANCLTDGLDHLESLGAKTAIAPLEGRGSAVRNAAILYEFIKSFPANERIILVSMSKGMVDTLQMLQTYPALQDRVIAVVSLVGATWGSPLAYMAPKWLKWIERNLPLPTCTRHGGEAVIDLEPRVREAFFETFEKPKGVRFYGLGAAVELGQLSSGMTRPYKALERVAGFNDGQMPLSGQFAPGSEILGVLNGDHIAVAMPFNRSSGSINRFVVKYGLEHNAFPREVMVEATVRRVLEDG